MRESFDALHKDSLEVLLEDVGTVTRGLEVTAAQQRFDLWFVPDPQHRDERLRRGLLGTLVDVPDGCAIEPFRNTPDAVAVGDCARKLMNHRHNLALAALRSSAGPEALRRPAPRVLILSPGDPRSARQEYALHEHHRLKGVYSGASGLGLVLVVLSRLPVVSDTLALRALARGPTFEHASRELTALPGRAWERKLVHILLRWNKVALTDTDTLPEEKKAMAGATPLFDKICRENHEYQRQADLKEGLEKGLEKGLKKGLKKGLEKGLEKGRLDALSRLFERRLSRALTESERATFVARHATLGYERLSDLVLDSDGPTLARWLADPAAR